MDEGIFLKQHVIMPARTLCTFLRLARLIFRLHGLNCRKIHAQMLKAIRSQEKLKTMLMQNFRGQIRCIMGTWKWRIYINFLKAGGGFEKVAGKRRG